MCNTSLEGMRVLVTASTRGIGRGIARAAAKCGAHVAINGRSWDSVERALEELEAEGLRLQGIPADLSVTGGAARLVGEAIKVLRGLDGLVYVPPPPPSGGFLEVGIEQWRLLQAPHRGCSGGRERGYKHHG